MLNPFRTAFLLAMKAQRAIELRLVRIAWRGAEARSEMMSMVGEKVVAAMEAANTLMTGGSQDQVLALYRAFPADNTRRLTDA